SETIPEEPIEEPTGNIPNIVTIDALEELQQRITLQNQTIERLQQQVQKLETFN
ncbi:14101_t:CDS:1, partial [Gigaspora margarita]